MLLANSGVMLLNIATPASADLLAVGGDRAEVRLHHAEVALEDAGEDLAHEGRAGGSRDGEARHRIPDEVDAERAGDQVAHLTDHRRHPCRDLGPNPHLIRKIGLVAEEESIDTCGLQ